MAIIVEQLASGAFAVRTAGAYALVMLAEDWHRFGRDDGRQVCVSLLCGLLRSRTYSADPADSADPTDVDFRRTVIVILASRRRDASPDDWTAYPLDLTDADLRGAGLALVNIAGTVLVGVDLTGADLTRANLTGSDLRGATLDHASLAGANLVGADLSGANLRAAELADCRLTRATLTDAGPQKATLNGIDFTDTILTGADLSGVRLTDARVLESLAARHPSTSASVSAAPDVDPIRHVRRLPREAPMADTTPNAHRRTPPKTLSPTATLTEARSGR